MSDTGAEGVTTEQQERLRIFQEVTGLGNRTSAVQVLRSCDWNVDEAVHLALAGADEETGSTSALPPAGRGGLGAPLLEAPISFANVSAVESPSPPGQRRGACPCCCPGWLLQDEGHEEGGAEQQGVVGWLSRGLRRLTESVMCLFRAFVIGATRAGEGLGISGPASGEALRQSLMTAYGPGLELPVFAEGSFAEVLRRGRQELKLIVVYLHSPISHRSREFCVDMLGSNFVRTMIDNNFLMWAGDISRGETHAVAMAVHAFETPCLAVILPASVDDVRPLGVVTADAQVDGVVALLTSCLDEMDAHRAEITARAEQQHEDRALREHQDREFHEALEMDRQRAEEQRRLEQQRQEEEQRARELEQERQREAERQEAQRQEKKEELRRRSLKLGAELPEASARVSLRLPAGQRIQRNFLPTATLEEVYEWAATAAFLPENEGKGLEIPERFLLKTPLPSRDLVERDRTVEELKLAGANILLLALEDDD